MQGGILSVTEMVLLCFPHVTIESSSEIQLTKLKILLFFSTDDTTSVVFKKNTVNVQLPDETQQRKIYTLALIEFVCICATN